MNDTDEQARRNHASGVGGTGAMEDAPVGYRNPPRKHRFKKGQSGNRGGRRRGVQNMLTVFKKIAREKVRVRIAGEVRVMTRADSVIWANYYAALNKNQKAMNNMILFADETGQFIDLEEFKKTGAPITHSESLTTEEFEALFGNPLPGDHDPTASNTAESKH